MSQQTRRNFIAAAGKAVAVTGLASIAGTAATATAKEKLFVHHVYFWLKNPDSQEDKAKLIAGLRKLMAVKTIYQHHIGLPAATNRDVIDSSYAVSLLLLFRNKTDQDHYQTDPVHLKFIEECSPLWQKVIVYDSEDI